jgi:inorganic pyrophosphatase/exopolyphosphatase
LLTTDFKEFMVNDTRFAVGTVEAASPATMEKRMPELLATMQRLAKEHGYTIAAEERYGFTPDRSSRFRKRNAG